MVKINIFEEHGCLNDMTGEKKGARGEGVCAPVCRGVSSAPSVAKEHIS